VHFSAFIMLLSDQHLTTLTYTMETNRKLSTLVKNNVLSHHHTVWYVIIINTATILHVKHQQTANCHSDAEEKSCQDKHFNYNMLQLKHSTSYTTIFANLMCIS